MVARCELLLWVVRAPLELLLVAVPLEPALPEDCTAHRHQPRQTLLLFGLVSTVRSEPGCGQAPEQPQRRSSQGQAFSRCAIQHIEPE